MDYVEGLLYSGGLSHFLVSVCGYIHIFLVVYDPEIIGGFILEEKSKKKKTKAVCSLERTNYGSFQNVQPPIIDPLCTYEYVGNSKGKGVYNNDVILCRVWIFSGITQFVLYLVLFKLSTMFIKWDNKQ